MIQTCCICGRSGPLVTLWDESVACEPCSDKLPLPLARECVRIYDVFLSLQGEAERAHRDTSLEWAR